MKCEDSSVPFHPVPSSPSPDKVSGSGLGEHRRHVLVIGSSGGITSLTVAKELIGRGHRVTIVDEDPETARTLLSPRHVALSVSPEESAPSGTKHPVPSVATTERWLADSHRYLREMAANADTGIHRIDSNAHPVLDLVQYRHWLRSELSMSSQLHVASTDHQDIALLLRGNPAEVVVSIPPVSAAAPPAASGDCPLPPACIVRDHSSLSLVISGTFDDNTDLMISSGCAHDIANGVDAILTEMDHDKMPPVISLGLILLANFLFNVSFYIIIPTATQYARALGATDLYSGLVIGGITLMSAVTLVPLNRVAVFRDFYRPSLDLAAGALVFGHVLYGIAGYCDSLALLLVGRLVNGLGFTGWLFVKRYCTDPRVVGLRRRTMCTNLLVAAQTLGMVCGPLFGSLLASLGTHSSLFNGNTYPAHVMALVWLLYWITVRCHFQEVPGRSKDDIDEIKHTNLLRALTRANWITTGAMSLTAFTTFFVLGAWESNIPIVGEEAWAWKDSDSGVFIAAGGLVSFVLILPVTWQTKRFQDRLILVVGCRWRWLGPSCTR